MLKQTILQNVLIHKYNYTKYTLFTKCTQNLRQLYYVITKTQLEKFSTKAIKFSFMILSTMQTFMHHDNLQDCSHFDICTISWELHVSDFDKSTDTIHIWGFTYINGVYKMAYF